MPGSVYDDSSPAQSSPPPPPLPRSMYTSPDDPFRNPPNSGPERRPSQDGERRPSLDDPLDRAVPTRSLTGDSFNAATPNFRTPSPEPGIFAQRRPSSSSSYGGRQSARKPSQDYPSVPYQPPGRKSSGENQTPYGNSSSQATAGVIIPNKSTSLPRRHGNALASAPLYPIHEFPPPGVYDDPSQSRKEDPPAGLGGPSWDGFRRSGKHLVEL